MVLTVTGEERQRNSTGDMIYNVYDQIAYSSTVMTLEPGDILATAVQADALALGIEVNANSQVVRHDGSFDPGLYVAGPLARAPFGELIGLPQVAAQLLMRGFTANRQAPSAAPFG